MTRTIRHLIGYALGFTVFFLLVPCGLYILARVYVDMPAMVPFGDDDARIIVATGLFLPGITFALWSNITLLFVGKGGPAEGFGVEVSPKTRRLVTTGPYRYTRNPMVFGMMTSYLAWSLFLNSIACVVALCCFFGIIVLFLKLSEEKRLIRDFGEEYGRYRHRVSMIVPLPPKRRL